MTDEKLTQEQADEKLINDAFKSSPKRSTLPDKPIKA